jgi:hypothetical protein
MDVFRLTHGLGAIAIVLTLTGCGISKASQCRQLSDFVNKLRPLAGKFDQEGKTYEAAVKAAADKNDFTAFKAASASSAAAFSGLSGELEGLIQEIQAIDLKDETLLPLRNRYLENTRALNSVFQTKSNSLKTLSTLENSAQGLDGLQKATANLTQSATAIQRLVVEEVQLVADFNNYCIEQK